MSLDSDHHLGHLLGEFSWNKGRAKALLWLWGILLLPSLLFSFVIIGLPGLILSIYFIYRSFTRLRTKHPVIEVYEQGLIDRRKKDSQIIQYADVKALYIAVVVVNGVMNYVLTLDLQNGQKLKIDEHVNNVDNLRRLLEEQIVQHQLPSTIAQYQQGTPIQFNNLQVTQSGLTLGKKTLPWSEFESAEIKRSGSIVSLNIRQKGNTKDWGSQPRDTFPNLALFFAIVNHIQGTQIS